MVNRSKESFHKDSSNDVSSKLYFGDSNSNTHSVTRENHRRGTSKMFFMAPTIKGIAHRKQEEKKQEEFRKKFRENLVNS